MGPAGPAAALHAQSVSPVISEYDRPATGRFQVSNPTLFPVTVVVEPQAFDLDETGRPTFGPLRADVRVRLSETSFQVPPRGSRTVYYEVEAPELPVWFTLYSTITGPRSDRGMRVRVQLPHTVYVYGDALGEDDVVLGDVLYDPEDEVVRATVTNAGSRLGRAAEVRVQADGSRTEVVAGFPLLPGRSRVVSVPWSGPAPPDTLIVDLGRFIVSRSVGPGSQAVVAGG